MLDLAIVLILLIITGVFSFYALPIIWRLLFSGAKNQQAQLDQLVASGFRIDHTLNGNLVVLFDDTKREIAFVYTDLVIRCSYDNIISHKWSWVDGNGVRFSNSLNFTLDNVEYPLIKVGNLSEKMAEFWYAKINAILKS